jgi:hypothetical protein
MMIDRDVILEIVKTTAPQLAPGVADDLATHIAALIKSAWAFSQACVDTNNLPTATGAMTQIASDHRNAWTAFAATTLGQAVAIPATWEVDEKSTSTLAKVVARFADAMTAEWKARFQ